MKLKITVASPLKTHRENPLRYLLHGRPAKHRPVQPKAVAHAGTSYNARPEADPAVPAATQGVARLASGRITASVQPTPCPTRNLPTPRHAALRTSRLRPRRRLGRAVPHHDNYVRAPSPCTSGLMRKARPVFHRLHHYRPVVQTDRRTPRSAPFRSPRRSLAPAEAPRSQGLDRARCGAWEASACQSKKLLTRSNQPLLCGL